MFQVFQPCNAAPDKVMWTTTTQRSFDALKEILTSEPVLHGADYTRPFLLQTDVADVRIGAVLSQKWGEDDHPVAYFSRKLIPREQHCLPHWSTIHRRNGPSVPSVPRFRQGQQWETHSLDTPATRVCHPPTRNADGLSLSRQAWGENELPPEEVLWDGRHPTRSQTTLQRTPYLDQTLYPSQTRIALINRNAHLSLSLGRS